MMFRQKMLDLIKQHEEANTMEGHLSRMNSNQSNTSPKNYLALVDEFMAANPDVSKAEAMRQVTRKNPEAHELWLDSVQRS